MIARLKNNADGFTLVELILAVAFLTVLLIATTQALIAFMVNFRQVKAQDFVQRESVYVSQVLERSSIASSIVNTSMGDSFSWEVLDGTISNFEAVCFDKSAFIFIREQSAIDDLFKYDANGDGDTNDPGDIELLRNADAYSLAQLPITSAADCSLQGIVDSYDPRVIFGLADNAAISNIDENNLGAEIISAGDGQLLKFDATVLDNGRRLAILYQVGTTKDLFTKFNSDVAQKDSEISISIEKGPNGLFRCRANVNDIDSCWVETKRIILNVGGIS